MQSIANLAQDRSFPLYLRYPDSENNDPLINCRILIENWPIILRYRNAPIHPPSNILNLQLHLDNKHQIFKFFA